MFDYLELRADKIGKLVPGEFLGISLKYTHELMKLNFIKYYRINIDINDYYPEQGIIATSPLNMDMVNIYYKREMDDYVTKSDIDKFKLQLEIIDCSLKYLFDKAAWDYTPVAQVGADIYRAGFVYEVPITLRGLPDGYEFLVRPNLKTSLFFIRITNETDKREIPVFKGTWEPLCMESLFKYAKFKNNYLKISNSIKTIEFEVNLSNDEVKINCTEDIWEDLIKRISVKG